MRRVLLIFVLSAMFTMPAFSAIHAGDAIEVSSKVDRREIAIGDRIRYTVSISGYKGTDIQIPEFRSNVIGEFEIKDHASRMHNGWFGIKTLYNDYFITSYAPGKKEIPPFEVKYKVKGQKDWETKKTGPVKINVISVLPKDLPADIRDIKGPVYYFEINWNLITFIVLLILLLVVIILYAYRSAHRKPIRLPHETALEELQSARSGLINTGDIKAYFVEVSDTIRRYIERALSLKAPEMTSEEFLNSLRDSTALTPQHKELLKGFMNACDLVKFAKYTPSGTETEELYLTAKNFIDETRGDK